MYEYENEEILHMLDETIITPAITEQLPIVRPVNLTLIANSGYQAVADLPFVLLYEQILHEYPHCQFILTTRENSEIWYKSWQSMTQSVANGMHIAGFVFPTIRIYSKYIRFVYAFVNKDTSYLTDTIPSDQNIKPNAIATYEEHNRRIRELIPASQLLEYNVRDGWGPICTFLHISNESCPTTPFPKTNSAIQMQAQSLAAFWFGTLLLLGMVYTFRVVIRSRRRRRQQEEEQKEKVA
jgi:Sulfotransferase domain